jgi:hypothetical protein
VELLDARDRYEMGAPLVSAGVGPVDAVRVGPGVGVGRDVPAYGGFNSGLLARVLPYNPGEYTRNILPGGVEIVDESAQHAAAFGEKS